MKNPPEQAYAFPESISFHAWMASAQHGCPLCSRAFQDIDRAWLDSIFRKFPQGPKIYAQVFILKTIESEEWEIRHWLEKYKLMSTTKLIPSTTSKSDHILRFLKNSRYKD